VDTEFKSPNVWDGWEWNPRYFSDPAGFFRWAKQQGLQTMVNIHPSISVDDPRLSEAERVAGGPLPKGDCILVEDCRVFDWSDPAELAAYFALQKQFTDQGADILWPDWCCDGSYISAAGVTPDTWINSRYAAEADARGRRGFSLQRMGSDMKEYAASPTFPTGPWAEHRYTMHFTADTQPTWDMLSFEAAFTAKEGAVGEPYVTHDIGAHMDIPDLPSPGHLPDDMYARWVQFGAFQPVLRLHSDHGDRLPWEYGSDAEQSAEKFLRLREALVPYSYTLARQAHDTGVPMVRSLYLDYPEYDEAYTFDRQYLYGGDVLVAPIAQPNNAEGVASTTVWFPPGTWTDYFTGRTYSGPSVRTVSAGWDTMPVFLRQGGILTTNTDAVDNDVQHPLTAVTVDVAAGGNGSFDLYEDAGEGHDYQRGQLARTQIRYTEPGGGHQSGTLTIGSQQGSFRGQVRNRAWTLRLYAVAAPGTVRLNGQSLPRDDAGAGWSYDESAQTLTVRTATRPTTGDTVITYG
jgi:alpha-glucosidase (family GH31 glycosyl hydrolase)